MTTVKTRQRPPRGPAAFEVSQEVGLAWKLCPGLLHLSVFPSTSLSPREASVPPPGVHQGEPHPDREIRLSIRGAQ